MREKNDDIIFWSGRGLNYLALAFGVIGLGVMLMAMPKYCDDYRFLSPFAGWMRDNGVIYPENGVNWWPDRFPWDELKYIWKWHWLNDNSRVCNIVAVPLLWLPKWVGSLFASIAWGTGVMAALRFANLNWRKSPLVPIGVFLWLFMMPWSDTMGSLVFEMNYPLSTGLAMLLVMVMMSVWMKGANAWLIFLAAIFVGAWQEAFSAPIFCGMAAVALSFRSWRTKRFFAGLIGLFLGLVWILLSPPTLNALLNGGAPKNLHSFIVNLGYHPLFFLDLAAGIACVCKGKCREMVINPRILFLWVSVIVSLSFGFLLREGERTAWWCDFASVPLLMMMTKLIFPRWNGGYSRKLLFLTAIIVAAMGVRIVASDMLAFRYRNQLRESVANALASPSEAVGVDWISTPALDVINGGMPERNFYGYPICALREYYGYADDAPFLSMIPKEMLNVTAETGEPLLGDAGIRRAGNWLFMPAKKEGVILTGDMISYNIRFDDEQRADYIPYIKFKSAADGENYLLILRMPSGYIYSSSLPKRADFLE